MLVVYVQWRRRRRVVVVVVVEMVKAEAEAEVEVMLERGLEGVGVGIDGGSLDGVGGKRKDAWRRRRLRRCWRRAGAGSG